MQRTISLIQVMNKVRIKNLVFSSNATVYGSPQYLPIDENHPVNVVSTYGKNKLHIEEMLGDIAHSDSAWKSYCIEIFQSSWRT